MATELLTDDRARGIRRLLLVVLGMAIVLVVVSVPLLLGDYVVYGGIVVAIAIVLGTLGILSLRAVQERRPGARKLSFRTGLATCVLSLPLMPIWFGLLTIVVGIGLLVVVLAPEREDA